MADFIIESVRISVSEWIWSTLWPPFLDWWTATDSSLIIYHYFVRFILTFHSFQNLIRYLNFLLVDWFWLFPIIWFLSFDSVRQSDYTNSNSAFLWWLFLLMNPLNIHLYERLWFFYTFLLFLLYHNNLILENPQYVDLLHF